MGELRLEELSPRGPGAISVLRLAGDGALERAGELCGRSLTPGALTLVRLASGDEQLDEALVLARDERCVELHVHGSPPLVARLFAALGLERTEGTRRTLEQGAAALLASAPCEAAARILLDQAEGALAARLAGWGRLSDDALAEELASLAEASRVARYALEPARVVLVGPVNAGKSTLFNALVGSERVITSAGAGTTRDLVLERVELAGWPVELLDTAGERPLASAGDGGDDSAGDADEVGQAAVEQAGQRLARRAREEADLVLRLRPPGDEARDVARAGERRSECVVELATFGDLDGAHAGAVSALCSPQAAAAELATRFRAALGLPPNAWQAGRGVLFEAEGRAWLAGLAGLSAADQRAAARVFSRGSARRR